MTGVSRRALLAALGVGVGSAGCLSASEDLLGDSTTTGDWIEQASNSPDPDHAIGVRNDAAEARTLRVAVVREATGRTAFETTEDLSPGDEYTLYNLQEADPEGVETFRVCAELVDESATTTETVADSEPGDSPRRDCATIDTSECYGNAHVTVHEDGTLQIIYAIC